MSGAPILTHIPFFFAGVPKTKPLSELQVPVTRVTTLENGLRVATQETYGPVSAHGRIPLVLHHLPCGGISRRLVHVPSTQLCTFGLVVDAGSRDEALGQEDGVCHLFEAMAFKSTRNMCVRVYII